MRPLVELTDGVVFCRFCNGTGCGPCKGRGEIAVDRELDRITCLCGQEITARDWEQNHDGLCAECGLDLERHVDAALAEAMTQDQMGPDPFPLDEWEES